MKKIIALILATIMLMSLVGCDYFKTNDDTTPPEKVKIRIGYMAGPTGMGMAKLVSDNGGLENGNEKYKFTKYADTAAAKADLAAGKIDLTGHKVPRANILLIGLIKKFIYKIFRRYFR